MNLGIEKSLSNEKVLVERRYFSEKAVRNFNKSLRKMNIHDVLQLKSTNEAYNVFINKYLEIFEASFPVRKKKQYMRKRKKSPMVYNRA